MADPISRRDEGYAEMTRKENDVLVAKIKKFCNRGDYKKHNVLLVGQIGSGKSSVINTLLYPIAGEYLERARSGGGITTTKTLELKWYPNCAAKPADFEHLHDESNEVQEVYDSNKNHTYQKEFKDLLHKLPDMFDAAGMKNKNDPETREILGLLIGGFINPETCITVLEEEQEKEGLGWLKAKYSTAKDEYKISCVVFVCSCTMGVPRDLINCVREVIEEIDPKTSRRKYDCDVFVLITKYDKVLPEGSTEKEAHAPETIYSRDSSLLIPRSREDTSGDSITLEKFKEFEEEIAKAFVMKGNFKDSHLRWASYNDSLPSGNVNVDHTSLKLLLRLTTPLHIEHRVNSSSNWLHEAITHVMFRVKHLSEQKYEMGIWTVCSVVIVFIAVLSIIFLGLNSTPGRI